jgi:hypothetical protein
MKRVVFLCALGLAACGRETSDDAAIPAPAASSATSPGMANAQKSGGVVAKPKDQAQLDRMILAGYTPHGEHLHPPGVNQCPLTKGTEAVM